MEKNIVSIASFKADHVVLEIEVKGGDIDVKQEESYKEKMGNHAKANYTEISIFFDKSY